ncbi:hypothetical protein VZT92_004935 [Zoarces viviparus]|uniref:Uncharacterized protein n=1 Tax=Zoarces viviparus TaxID=48416 RepID=A0AAW1FR13_ZOAVI
MQKCKKKERTCAAVLASRGEKIGSSVSVERVALTARGSCGRLGLHSNSNNRRLLTRIGKTIDSRAASKPATPPFILRTQLLPHAAQNLDRRAGWPMRSSAGTFGSSRRR